LSLNPLELSQDLKPKTSLLVLPKDNEAQYRPQTAKNKTKTAFNSWQQARLQNDEQDDESAQNGLNKSHRINLFQYQVKAQAFTNPYISEQQEHLQ